MSSSSDRDRLVRKLKQVLGDLSIVQRGDSIEITLDGETTKLPVQKKVVRHQITVRER